MCILLKQIKKYGVININIMQIKDEIKNMITEKYLTVYVREEDCIELRALFLHKAIINHEGDKLLRNNLNRVQEYLVNNGFVLDESEKWSVVESYLYKKV